MHISETYILWEGCTFCVQQIQPNRTASTDTLVFLHDALGSIPQWKDFPKQLAKTCRLNAVVIERQGHGKSSRFSKVRTKNYLQEEAFDVLPNILALLKIQQPILVGHSDGGTIALLYASQFKTKALVSIAAHVLVEEMTVQGIRDTLEHRKELKEKLSKYHFGKTEQLIRYWSETWLASEFQGFNILKELQSITSPIMVIQSDHDPYGSLLQIESIFQQVASTDKASLVVTNGGHLPHLAKTTEVVHQIADFLSNRSD